MRTFKSIFVSIIILFFFTNSSWSQSASEFISSLSNEASEILSSKISDEEKIIRLKEIGKRSVDIKGVGLYTLGKYRKTLTDNQKKQYEELFEDYFLKSFSGRLVGYNDAKIAVLSEDIKNEKYTIVYSKLIGTSDRPEVKIDWRVYTKNPENPLIRDLVIEGLSLARTQKEEFNSIISNNDGKIEALFENLNKFLEK
ncbi:ABC transporter substrate-binding protein [Candidatus Pelagibacter sp.]|nr:ABC transporter substrate-binding protein [Candidatus Pelagibacter sp.]